MRIKEGEGWKACHNEAKGVYGAEVMFQGSWDLYEITGAVFGSLTKKISGADAGELIRTGRHLYAHVNDRCGPPYDVVLDDDYAEYCPWAGTPTGKVWSRTMTDAAVELFGSEKQNRAQRRKKRGQGGER
ncbi:MAG: hypothetical protein II737_05155 [Mailhella sp.]|nr:hypothetical protein [Mailhella sp.]